MSFFPTSGYAGRQVGAIGNKAAKIALIGEALGAQEEKSGIPFSGHAGGVLDQCLHSANLIRSDLYITNVVKIKPKGNNISPYYKEGASGNIGKFTEEGMVWVRSLWDELKDCKANVLVPLGKPAMLAVMGTDKVSKLRGYVAESRGELGGRKCIPTFHPAATLRGQYIWRYYISNDLIKAKRESRSAEIVRPYRDTFAPDSFRNAVEWLEYFATCDRLSIDTEIINFEVSVISISDQPDRAMALPMYHSPNPKWTVQEEAHLWRLIANIMGSKKIVKVLQNGIFDVHFFRVRCGIWIEPLTPEMFEDTMIAHHIMFPDMLKGLAFLGSMYCGAQKYWKDMVKFTNIKDNA